MNYKSYLTTEPYDYQKEGIEFAMKHRYTIIADEMGLGKSLQAIAVAVIAGGNAVVVCPSYLKGNWKHEFKKFSPYVRTKICSSRNNFEREGNQICFISYSQLSKASELFKGVTTVIIDEAHYLKSIDAQRTNHFHGLLEGSNSAYFVGLSGTPIKGRIPEYYSLLCLCSYNPLKTNGKNILTDYNYWEFCNTFTNRTSFKIGNRKITKYTGSKNLVLLKTYVKDKFIRRLSKNVLDLPGKFYKEVMVDYEKADKALKESWEHHSAGERKEHVSSAKRNSGLVKADFTIEYAKDLHEKTQEPILIFTDHPAVCEKIEKRLSKYGKVEIITGSTSVEHRYGSVERFQEGKITFLVATIGAASTGFNLTRTNHIIFNDRSWSATDNEQAEKRIHRIGQVKDCIYHIILGSLVDLMIYKNLKEKQKLLKEVEMLTEA